MSLLRDHAVWVVGLAVLHGFFPQFLLNSVVRLYPKGHPRRTELLAEIHAVPYRRRWLWVADIAALALWDGIGERVQAQRSRTPELRHTYLLTRVRIVSIWLSVLMGGFVSARIVLFGGVVIMLLAPIGVAVAWKPVFARDREVRNAIALHRRAAEVVGAHEDPIPTEYRALRRHAKEWLRTEAVARGLRRKRSVRIGRSQ